MSIAYYSFLKRGKKQPSLPPDLRLLVNIAGKLNPQSLRLAIKLVRVLKEQEDERKRC